MSSQPDASYRIQAHHTAHLTGTLAAGGTLFIDSSYKSGGGVAYVSGTSENDGLILIAAQPGYFRFSPTGGGSLINEGVLTNAGRITVAGGGEYSGSTGKGGALINNGTLLNSGYISLGSAYSSSFGYPGNRPGLLVDNGVLHNVGSIEISDYYDSYYNGHYGVTPGRLIVTGSLVNSAQISVSSFGYTGASIDVTGTLQNDASGYIGSKDSDWTLDVAVSGVVENAGLLAQGKTVSGYTPSIVAGTFYNSGTIALQDGEYNRFNTISGAVLILTGVLDSSGLITVSGGASNGISSSPYGATLSDAGTLNNAGQIEVYGGTPDSTALRAGGGGLLRVSGTLINHAEGAVELLGGQAGAIGAPGATLLLTGVLTNAGLITVGAGETAVGAESGYGAQLIDEGTLVNTGSIVVEGGAGFGGALAFDTADDPPGLIVNAGATLLDRGAISGAGALSSAGFLVLNGSVATATLQNSGLLVGAGQITCAVLVNTGTVEAVAGTLTIDSAISGNGVFEVGPHGTLDINGTLGAGVRLTFAPGGDGMLRAGIDDIGTIAGFAGTDKIDITDLLPGGAPTVSFVQTGDIGVLTIDEGGRSAMVTLAGHFAASEFCVASDGGMGTMITLSDAAGSG